jgi:bifunctional DNA-binding transcriptional regulator/antitoxin component of YhaV-PrlF toxin-antitoxin module
MFVLTDSNDLEIRKVQALTRDRSLTLVFPKQFALELGISKGDFLKCRVDANRLIVEKLDTQDMDIIKEVKRD